MICLKFLLSAISLIGIGVILVIYSEKYRSEAAFYGNTKIKIGGCVLLMFGILILIGSLIRIQSDCSP